MSPLQLAQNNMLRLIISFIAAVGISLLLFLLMHQLLNHNNTATTYNNGLTKVDIRQVRTPKQQPKNTEAKAPKPAPAIADLAVDASSSIKIATTPTVTSDIFTTSTLPLDSVELSVEQTFWSAPVGNTHGNAQQYLAEADTGRKQIVPIATRRPNIPKIAYDNHINGWVLLAFTVTNQGKVKNIRVMDAEPRGIFEANAIAAVKGWLYSSYKGDEKQISQRIDFDWTMYSYNMNYQ